MHADAASWLTLAAVLLLAACGGGSDNTTGSALAPEEKVLNVYNWSDYIGPSTIADFEKKTGIKVNYDTYDSNEILETKLLTGHTGYDIVVPAATIMERLIKAGVFQKLDKSRLPNLVNMDPDIMQRVAVNDPGNEHSIVYTWLTVGIGYNPWLVEKALGTNRIDSWAAVLDPTVAAKLAKCGIALIDSPTDVFGSVAIYKGLDPNSEKPEDLAVVEEDADEDPPVCAVFSLVVLHQRPRRGRNLRGTRLERRRIAGARPRRGCRNAGGSGLRNAQGRRVHLVRYGCDTGRRTASG